MTSFSGPILNLGKSVTGITYSKDVLTKLVDDFNEKFRDGGALGQIAKAYPINPHFNFKSMTHITKTLHYDEEQEAVIANIEIMDNVKGLHLLKLFKNVPKRVKMCPVLVGKSEDDIALEANLIRIDFFYNKTIEY